MASLLDVAGRTSEVADEIVMSKKYSFPEGLFPLALDASIISLFWYKCEFGSSPDDKHLSSPS